MKKEVVIQIACLLLVFVLSYTTAAKLLNFSHYTRSMLSQPVAEWVIYGLIYLVPLVEGIAILLLLLPSTRKKGFWLSTALMCVFTFYVCYILLSGLAQHTCPCGGLFSQLNWSEHLLVNSSLLLISFLASLFDEPVSRIFHGREKRGNADASEQTK